MKNLTLSLLCAGLMTTTAIAEDICDGAFQAQNYKQSAECYIKQLKNERSFDNLFRSGASYSKQGRYKEALPYLKEAEKKATTPHDYSVTYSYLATTYAELGNSAENFAYSMKKLALDLKSGDRKEIGTSYNNLGGYYLNHKQPQKALEYYEKALDYQEESAHSVIYNNLAITYNKLNNYQKQEEMYKKSIEIAEKIGDYHSLANCKKNLGIFYFNNARDSEARPMLEEALIIARTTKRIDQESQALSTLSILDHYEGKVAQAKEKASEALRLAKLSGTQNSVLSDAQDAWNIVNGK